MLDVYISLQALYDSILDIHNYVYLIKDITLKLKICFKKIFVHK